jgi:YVTN family beta-propeller protein
MNVRLKQFFPLLAILPAFAASAQPSQQKTPSPALVILSKRDRTLAIVDPVSLQVAGRVPVGDDPHEVAVSADGKTAFVSNYGFGEFHTLAVIDLVSQMRREFIDLGALRGPHGLMVQDGKVWFTAEAAKAIGSYNPGTDSIDWIMGTGQNRTHMLYVFPGANKIITTNVNSATVTILEKTEGRLPVPSMGMPPGGAPPNPQSGPPPGAPGMPPGMPGGPPPTPPGGDWQLTVIAVGRGSEGFDVSPDGKEAWIANAQDGTVSIIDIARKQVTATLQANVRGANRLKFTPDGTRALISAGSDLVVLDAATHKEVKRINIGHGLEGLLIQPDGARAFVASTPDNFVAVIDLKTLTVTGKIDAGPNPDGMAWAGR